MKKFRALLGNFVLFILFLSLPFIVYADEIKVGAGAAPSNQILKPIKPHFEKSTNLKLTLLEIGPKLAMQDLLKGSIDAACAGLSFDEWAAMMEKEGMPINKSELQVHIIGKSRAVAIINKSNPISKLTKDQLKGIFSGKITNWKEVGGPDMPVIVVWANLTQGMNSLFINKALDGISITKEVLETTTGPELKELVAYTPEAIGITSIGVVDASVKVPEQPEAVSDISCVTKGSSAKFNRLFEFIKGEGQKYIKQ